MNRTKLAALEAAIRDCDDEHEPTEADVLAYEREMAVTPLELPTAQEIEDMVKAAEAFREACGEDCW